MDNISQYKDNMWIIWAYGHCTDNIDNTAAGTVNTGVIYHGINHRIYQLIQDFATINSMEI